jgi:hypothetical protein
MENNNKVVLRNISIYSSLGLCNPSFCSKHCSDFIKIEKQQELVKNYCNQMTAKSEVLLLKT